MANWLQKFSYILSNTVPLIIMTAVVRYIKCRSLLIPAILFGVALCVAVVFTLSFTYGKRNCSVKKIAITKFSSKDDWIVAYIVSYLLPFVDLAVPEYNIVTLVVVAILMIVSISSITVSPNILLALRGYHFYSLETIDNGVADYLLITRKKSLRHKDQITEVSQIFEKMLVDIEVK